MNRPSQQRFLHGTRQIWSFNWPFYALSFGAIGAGLAFLRFFRPRGVLRWGAEVGTGLGVFWTLASLAVSWWVYDHSPIMDWRHLERFFPEKPRSWAHFHAGLDEATGILNGSFGEGQTFDFYEAATMTEPSIRRARALFHPEIEPQSVNFRALPLADNSLDAAFLLFSAHEIRSASDRDAFFSELARVLKPGGKLILVEHVRDMANFLAFGPGFLHFWAPSEWRRLCQRDFEMEHAERFTPFVRLWVWSRKDNSTSS